MKNWAIVLASVLLAACAVVPVAEPDRRHFHDELFAAPVERIRADDIFALSPEMRGYLNDEIAARARTKGRQKSLVDALYNKADLRLEYDSTMTRTAAQAFAARSGNCLSLVIMTAAFAKELDLPVQYQQVIVDDAWGRSGDIYLAIGHVNLTLGRRKTDEGGFGYRVGRKPPESEGMTIDFLPQTDMRNMRTRAIGEDVVIAMFMNNRAVEALSRGDVDGAYWWAREAIVQSPSFVTAYNTLGAIYQRHGNAREAEPVLRFVLERESGNTQAMSNLVLALRTLGRTEESQRMAATLKQLDPEPPFSHFNRGVAAMRAGDLHAAKAAFAREIARAPDYHEFHFWLALAHLGLGENEDARRRLGIALENSTTRRDTELYAAKLDRLKQTH
jgi:tetratricopeptide (TPR) repeat protein